MNVKGKTVGILITSSFHNFKIMIKELKKLTIENTNIILIIEKSFYTNVIEDDFIKEIKHITNNKIFHSLQEIKNGEEKIDLLMILPSTSNMIAKLVNNITDNFETNIINYISLRDIPIVFAVLSNDGLSSGAENLGKLLNTRNHYFVPFKQVNPITKPRAISFDASYLYKTIKCALNKEQIQPILLSI